MLPVPPLRIAIIGSGPCGLMAATHLAQSQSPSLPLELTLFERRSGLGRKLLVAGSSGLNISNGCAPQPFAQHYTGMNTETWLERFRTFGPAEWIRFIEKDLGMETFLGTSDRYFVREMKASGLLKKWTELLLGAGVRFQIGYELKDFTVLPNGSFTLDFGEKKPSENCDRIVFALGGGSWEESAPIWPDLFRKQGIDVLPFSPANVGYEVEWKPEFLKEAEGKPLKKIRFENRRGTKDGELVVTNYGLEGTPIYFHGEPGIAYLDLRPDLSSSEVLERMSRVKENLAPIRRAKQKLDLCEASLALLFHHLSPAEKADLRTLAVRVKRFPITLKNPRPLVEAISSRGGVAISELGENLELRKLPGAYCGGEMVAWDAPTGGFLIQAAVSMGAQIAKAILADANHSPRRI